MDRKLESNTYQSLEEFVYDADLIFKNCRQYNDPGSNCAYLLLHVYIPTHASHGAP